MLEHRGVRGVVVVVVSTSIKGIVFEDGKCEARVRFVGVVKGFGRGCDLVYGRGKSFP